MNIQLKYGYFINLHSIAEAAHMFVNKINSAIKTLTTEPNMRFHSKNHMIQLIMYASGMPMCTESFKEVESYLEDGAEAILRDFGVHHG